MSAELLSPLFVGALSGLIVVWNANRERPLGFVRVTAICIAMAVLIVSLIAAARYVDGLI